MLKHILGLLLIVSIVSCSDSGYKILIDNPTSKQITVTIDKEVVVLDSAQSKLILVKSGDHTMLFKDSTFHFDMPEYNSHDDIKFVVNPTRSGYILRQLTYMKTPPTSQSDLDREQQNRLDPDKNLLPYDTIQLLDVVIVSGNYKKTSAQFIDDSYDYGIDDEIPSENKAHKFQNRLQLVKLYREKAFLEHFMSKHKGE